MTREKTNSSRAVYVVVGADRFLRSECVRSLLRRISSDPDDLYIARFDGASAELAEVLDEVRTPSLLGGRRVAIVDDADALITAKRSAMEHYCESPAEAGTLVLVCARFPKNTKLYKIVQRLHEVVYCEAPKWGDVPRWLIARARSEYDKKIGREAAARLIDHIGDAPGILDSELGKLAAYVGARGEITPEDVETLVGQHREETVFAVIDAIAVGDAATALRLWDQVLATDRAAPARALAGLAWGVRRLLEVRGGFDRGVPVRELAPRLHTDPDTAKRRLDRATTEMLKRQLDDLLDADLAVKTGAGAIGTAVERFIVTHCHKAMSGSRAR